MKIPDFFYLKQAQTLERIHDMSIVLLYGLFSKNNPNNAYDSDWGRRQLGNLEASLSCAVLNAQAANRILRQRTQPTGFLKRPELDRDMLRIEHIIENIEREMDRLYRKQTSLVATIILLALFFIIGFLSVRP